MKKYLLSLFILLPFISLAQILDPIKWKTSVEKINEQEYNLVITANIDNNWHLYSQKVAEGGPIATKFTFEPQDSFEIIGETSEEKGHKSFDPIFEMDIKYFETMAVFKQKIKQLNPISKIVSAVTYMVCDDTRCLPPTEKELIFEFDENILINSSPALKKDNDTDKVKEKKIISASKKPKTDKGIWTIFIIAFFSGFLALLTPCVFPMIPLTVSFFTKQSKTKASGIRNAIFYGISIVVIYVLLGTVVTAIFGASALNELATNVWINLIFFILLVVFAVSFLGAFEISLPNSWANKIDSRANKGKWIGIFFMALALAVVSFSCTGPIVGVLLVEAASKGGIAPIIGMLGFSLAIALPFTLFAAFPGWLNSLPKSGGWLNTVKVVLGFLELALAFKFLSQADLVVQAHLLEREVFIAIWIAIGLALTLYLLGKITLPHDSVVTRISVGRLMLALICLSFTVYMIPGLWGAPLNLISAFPPPQEYSESPYGVGYKQINSSGNTTHSSDLPDGGHLLAPHDILAFKDYDKGLSYAKKVKKPIMLDFTGWACVNCRKMEQQVWVKPEILNILKNKVVLISLYVDEQTLLEEPIPSKLKPGKKLKYIGQKWSELQQLKYGANAQPFYVLIDLKEEKLNEHIAFTPDAEKYLQWLKKGIDAFEY